MFKQLFKKYKSKCSPASLHDVILYENNYDGVEIRNYMYLTENKSDYYNLGLKSPKEWEILHAVSQPGLLIVKNPFTSEGQRLWIKRCLTEYPTYPNKTNLDAHGLLTQHENWWNVCQTDADRKKYLYRKLRWVTLGYHHNWNTKIYSEQSKSVIPKEIVELCRFCAKTIGNWDLTAQAGIVNYYHSDSTLSGHVDHSEPNDEAPILSFSFGSRAIFLVEDVTNDQNIMPILLESGDIVIMSKQSRLALHGIPKIMPPIQPYPWINNNIDKCLENEWNKCFDDYITTSRINLNVRQVLRPEQSIL